MKKQDVSRLILWFYLPALVAGLWALVHFLRRLLRRLLAAKLPLILKKPTFLAAVALLALSVCRTYGYGPEGHWAVGEIAETRLKGTSTGDKIKELLDGESLGFAATIPDRIKSWDNAGGPDDEHGFKMPTHPKVEEQLRAFWNANKPGAPDPEVHPSHHTFHYTDVPLVGNEKYADGKVGRSQWDIIHMINYCCQVLSGQVPEQNDRAITKTVAVILLAHYIGDLHQPLHVGAEYFDNGRPANPDADKNAIGDEGGNTFTVALIDPPGANQRQALLRLRDARGNPSPGAVIQPPGATPAAPRRRPKLHGYWDSNAVKFLMQEVYAQIKKTDPAHGPDFKPQEFDAYLAKQEPANWKPDANLMVKDWAESWANEILPIAREAHDRLEFTQLKVEDNRGRPVEGGVAVERPGRFPLYANWSAGVVRVELEKAGCRLALMLDKVLK